MDTPNLTLNDIVSMKNLIEAACSRGSFKAHEMSSVGDLYNRITAFIEASSSQLAAEQAPPQSQGEENA